MKVLIIEDDERIRSFLKKGLEQAGFTVDAVGEGELGLEMALDPGYAVAVVDLMLPGRDGLSIIEEMRGRGVQTPVLILSARRSVDDRVRGLQQGGDDYLTKPFSFSELLARVRVLARRAQLNPAPTELVVADLRLDRISRVAWRRGVRVELTPKEFALLELLMAVPGQPVSRTVILERLWGYFFDPQTNVVDVLVSRVRAKVDRDFEPKRIRTVRGVGYVLDPL